MRRPCSSSSSSSSSSSPPPSLRLRQRSGRGPAARETPSLAPRAPPAEQTAAGKGIRRCCRWLRRGRGARLPRASVPQVAPPHCHSLRQQRARPLPLASSSPPPPSSAAPRALPLQRRRDAQSRSTRTLSSARLTSPTWSCQGGAARSSQRSACPMRRCGSHGPWCRNRSPSSGGSGS